MLHKKWYTHVCDQTFGPISESSLLALLNHGRLQFSDFAWADGMAQWQRLSEIDVFSKHQPGFPKVGPPGVSASSDPKPVTSEKPSPKHAADELGRVPIFGTIAFEKEEHHQVIKIGEIGLLIKPKKELPNLGKEAHFQLASLVFDSPLEMTGILVKEPSEKSENTVVVEFTKLNPLHRRQIKAYVESVISKK